MKKISLSMLIALTSLFAKAQLKNDNLIGLGFGVSKQKSESSLSTTSSETTNTSANFSFSHFFADNQKYSVGFSFGHTNADNGVSDAIKSNSYNFSAGYGRYFPILKNFYAQILPSANYGFVDYDNNGTNSGYQTENYSISANLLGGITWFPVKHFSFEVNVIGIGFGYAKQTVKNTNVNYLEKVETTSFGITNTGGFNTQSFTVFYKF